VFAIVVVLMFWGAQLTVIQ